MVWFVLSRFLLAGSGIGRSGWSGHDFSLGIIGGAVFRICRIHLQWVVFFEMVVDWIICCFHCFSIDNFAKIGWDCLFLFFSLWGIGIWISIARVPIISSIELEDGGKELSAHERK